MKNLTKITGMMLIISLVMSACSSTTSVTGSYKDPSFTAATEFKKIFVAGLTSNVPARQKIETSMAEAITSRGFAAVKSLDVFTPDFQSSSGSKSDLVLQKIRETGSDGILTVALVNKETESRYVPGSAYPVGAYPYYGTFGGYWGNFYGAGMYDPGYYTTDKTYYVETNLYDAKTEKIVWSAQSQTMNPSNIDDFLAGYKKALAKQLAKDGLITASSK
ncbi:hypothetical protein GS399_09260 [Pedobacter sp. HMF7647]|uniref:DUF4136 domain-containing protein n=1 Tax=Hufsiella arboris TaxID=2695275 RepID=A0A7K1Y987_9SPHI|nr:hypothetical protein [Hufsiella arboris]MXV51156.1 hypothetical protein [Hufsiella arboris]